jgi:hypothetical protein
VDNELHPAYIAGFIDGEGTITLAITRWLNGRPILQPRIQVSSTDDYILEAMYKQFGGSLRLPKPNGSSRHKPVYRWDVFSKDEITILLETILPYLRIKRRHAELILQFITTCMLGRERGKRSSEMDELALSILDEIRTINKRGNPAAKAEFFELLKLGA